MRTLSACIVIWFVLLMTQADGHEWYARECCHDQHCHPVADGVVTDAKGGVNVVGFGFVENSNPRLRWSRDNEDHLCVQAGRLVCVYRRPKGM
jgi:hypothetical protein